MGASFFESEKKKFLMDYNKRKNNYDNLFYEAEHKSSVSHLHKMNKRDCTLSAQWTSRAKEFLQTRSRGNCLGEPTDVRPDILEFLSILEQVFIVPGAFSTYHSYCLNLLPVETYRTTREWFVAALGHYGNDFLRTLFFILCDKNYSVLVDFVLGYNCHSNKGMLIYAKRFYLSDRIMHMRCRKAEALSLLLHRLCNRVRLFTRHGRNNSSTIRRNSSTIRHQWNNSPRCSYCCKRRPRA